MNADSHDAAEGRVDPLIDPERLAEARRQSAEHLAHVRSLKEKVQNGTATPEEETEYDDMTWWMDHPVPALPVPEGTPNPWELPRPPRKPKPKPEDGDR